MFCLSFQFMSQDKCIVYGINDVIRDSILQVHIDIDSRLRKIMIILQTM